MTVVAPLFSVVVCGLVRLAPSMGPPRGSPSKVLLYLVTLCLPQEATIL